MVYLSRFSNLDTIFNEFFHIWPTETKPPIDQFPIFNDDESEVKGWEIQLALAGFSKEDIEVSSDEEYLIIEGDNTFKKDIAEKYKCKFNRQIVYNKKLNVKESKVSLEEGILRIQIPISKPLNKKTKLFGN